MIKTYKVKGEDDQSQLSFMLCYYRPLMNNIFLLKYKKKTSSGKTEYQIQAPYKLC